MNLLPLLDGQNIRICNHRRGCGVQNDINDNTTSVHLHKEPNHGSNFHGVIRIPLNQPPTAEIHKEINQRFSRKQIQKIREKLIKEITEAFTDKPNDATNRQNFVREIVDLLSHNWNDKLSSEDRAKDVAQRLALAFGLENEVENILRRTNNGEIVQYSSIYQVVQKKYFITITPENIDLGEISGRMKCKYNNN